MKTKGEKQLTGMDRIGRMVKAVKEIQDLVQLNFLCKTVNFLSFRQNGGICFKRRSLSLFEMTE